jgi:hypothetical protein
MKLQSHQSVRQAYVAQDAEVCCDEDMVGILEKRCSMVDMEYKAVKLALGKKA